MNTTSDLKELLYSRGFRNAVIEGFSGESAKAVYQAASEKLKLVWVYNDEPETKSWTVIMTQTGADINPFFDSVDTTNLGEVDTIEELDDLLFEKNLTKPE